MAGSVNKVILVGNLGADPEIRRTQDGRPVANLRVATSKSWKDKTTGERREKTEWHRVVIFNENLCRIAEQYLKKGSKVFIEGQLQTRKWQDQVRPGPLLDGSCAAGLPWRADAARPRRCGRRRRGWRRRVRGRGGWRRVRFVRADAQSRRRSRRQRAGPARRHGRRDPVLTSRDRHSGRASIANEGRNP